MRSQRSSLSRLSTVLATVPSDAKENLISKTILHYRVLERLGSGGMGVVYKAKDQKLRRYVALKFISEPLVSDLSVVRRFKQEARAASKLNHPNICTIYEINQHRGKPFIAMELIEGDSLKELIRRRQSLSIERIVAIAIQTIDALAEAHAKGIVHRDVKPANIFVNGEDIVKLVDFGLAKPILGSVESSGTTARLGDSGGVAGTYYYMSPEQALGRPLDGRSDLFAFGVVLYEMSTGRMPFEGQTLAAVFDGILNRRPVPPSRLNSEIPPALEAIVNKALQKDIHLRYQTASELRSDLVRLQSGSVP